MVPAAPKPSLPAPIKNVSREIRMFDVDAHPTAAALRSLGSLAPISPYQVRVRCTEERHSPIITGIAE